MTKNTPRIFISLLLMLLCIGILPVSAFASSGDYPDDTLPDLCQRIHRVGFFVQWNGDRSTKRI